MFLRDLNYLLLLENVQQDIVIPKVHRLPRNNVKLRQEAIVSVFLFHDVNQHEKDHFLTFFANSFYQKNDFLKPPQQYQPNSD